MVVSEPSASISAIVLTMFRVTKQVVNVLMATVNQAGTLFNAASVHFILYTLTAPCENLFLGMCGQQRPRSACASVQSDQRLYCPFTRSMNNNAPIRHAHAQDDMNPHILRTLEDTYSPDLSPIIVC